MASNVWPDLSGIDLSPTLGMLHWQAQIVGKIRLVLTPWENHGWHVPLYLSARGFATGLVLTQKLGFTVEFDLLSAELVVRATTDKEIRLPLASGKIADFYASILTSLRNLGVAVSINAMPNELPAGVRFDEDCEPRFFDPDIARQYWRALLQAHRVLQRFRTRFTGKVSPIHLFWGSFDLAVTRFSGREAPRHPGGAPFLNDAVMREAYSREVSSAGLWPNFAGSDGPCFYSYAWPVPDRYAARAVKPAGARFDTKLGEFVLPYSVVQASEDPDERLIDFLQTTYEAAADLAGWDRELLERQEGLLGHPPIGS